jgi:RNA polymerase sigma-70 factor (ECF subfamily)
MTGGAVSLTDVDLWDALARRDSGALGELYDRHAKAIYNFAFRRLSSWSTAEEVVQTTFVNVWRRAVGDDLPGLRRDTARPYLLGIAARECANAARSRRRRTAIVRRLASQPPEPDHSDAVAGRVDSERRMADVRRVVDRLPAGQRDVLELVAWSGLTLAEAADALGLPEGTVKSRWSRARARLNELTERVGEDER